MPPFHSRYDNHCHLMFAPSKELTWGCWWISTRWRIARVTHCKDLKSICDTVTFCNASLITPHKISRQHSCSSQLTKFRHKLNKSHQLLPANLFPFPFAGLINLFRYLSSWRVTPQTISLYLFQLLLTAHFAYYVVKDILLENAYLIMLIKSP